MTEPSLYILDNYWKKLLMLFSSLMGLFLISIELTCYIIIFRHISIHNNTIMKGILDQNTLQKRNRVNAISLTGLFACWSMLLFHNLIGGVLSFFIGTKWNRDMAAFLRYFEFALAPYIQIRTSQPIKRYLTKHNG